MARSSRWNITLTGMAGENEPLGIRELNREFYERDPVDYITMRLAHLMLVGTHDSQHAERLARGIKKGDLEMSFGALFDRVGDRPSPSQQFVALEAELLLSHATETVLRYAHAHAEPSACPWQRMARVEGAGEFKEWVKRHIAEACDDDLDRLVDDRLFTLDQTARAGGIPILRRHLREFADLFLDAEGYNAGKHGLGLSGNHLGFRLALEGDELLDAQGLSLSFLTVRGKQDAETWRHHLRLTSFEVAIALIFAATRLLDGIRERGEAEHLDVDAKPFEGVRSVPKMLESFGFKDTRIVHVTRTITEDGTSPDIEVSTAHLNEGSSPQSDA